VTPGFSPDRRWVAYLSNESVSAKSAFGRSVGNTGFSSYDLAPNGKRFAIFMRPAGTATTERPRMNLLFNVFGEIRRASPAK
jgi:hypothetical protein